VFEALHGSLTVNGIRNEYQNIGNVTSLSNIFSVVINILLSVTFAVSFIGMAYALFQFVISRGDKDLVGKAKNALTWSVAALLISFFVLVFKNALYSLIGVTNEFTNTTP